MDNSLNYETYLFISSKKIILTLKNIYDEKIFYEELLIGETLELNIFEKVDKFLNENVFKIEKKFKNFIEKISIILDLDIFFNIKIFVKKNNFNDVINLKSLNHLLNEAKESCKKTLDQKKIIHMIVLNYNVDDKSYTFFPKDMKCQNYSVDLRLVCVDFSLIRDLETILKKYHISLDKLLSAKYIKTFSSPQDSDLFLTAKKIIEGRNPNEVIFIKKTSKNKGFFEKFFNFFN